MKFFWPVYILFSMMLLGWVVTFAPPRDYPANDIVYVAEGSSISSVAEDLYMREAIPSTVAFKLAARVMGGVQAGAYSLGGRQSAFTLAARFATGDTGLEPVLVTIPEGANVREVLGILESEIPGFDVAGFAKLSEDREGYLFPDTYEFYPGASPTIVFDRLTERARAKLDTLASEIAASGHTEAEIVILASILEKEARQYETMRMVSGILWKRIEIGMALQVDAVFGYIYGTPTFHPSLDDLEIDSPYNTYKYRGLPPGPIGNPGMNALKAALNPEPSPYLYYLTGSDGTMHYAKTFEQHIDNRRYLK